MSAVLPAEAFASCGTPRPMNCASPRAQVVFAGFPSIARDIWKLQARRPPDRSRASSRPARETSDRPWSGTPSREDPRQEPSVTGQGETRAARPFRGRTLEFNKERVDPTRAGVRGAVDSGRHVHGRFVCQFRIGELPVRRREPHFAGGQRNHDGVRMLMHGALGPWHVVDPSTRARSGSRRLLCSLWERPVPGSWASTGTAHNRAEGKDRNTVAHVHLGSSL